MLGRYSLLCIVLSTHFSGELQAVLPNFYLHVSQVLTRIITVKFCPLNVFEKMESCISDVFHQGQDMGEKWCDVGQKDEFTLTFITVLFKSAFSYFHTKREQLY